MPKIPFRENSELIRHRSTVVHASGGPGMDFNMREAQSMIRFGESIRDAGSRLGSAAMKFAEQKIDTENKLASTEARNLYTSMQDELKRRMADNPNEIDHFKEWAVEADQKYAEASKEITGRMSANYRKQFEAEMSGLRQHATDERDYIARQAITQKNYDLFQSQWKDAALRGDAAECSRMLEEHRGVLISEQEYKQKQLDYNRLSTFGAVKREVEAASPGIVERLKERDGAGKYKNYTGLEESARVHFVRIAEANDAQKRSDENQALVDRLNRGDQITLEQIEKNFEGLTAPEAIRQKNQQRQIVQHFINAQNTAKRQEERLEKLRKDDALKKQVDAYEYQLLSFEFSNDPAVRQKQYADMRNEILTRYAGNGPASKKLLTQLNETFKEKIKPDSSYKSTFVYKNAMEILGTMKGDFDCYKKPGVWSCTSDETVKASNYEMMKVKLDEFIRVNPSATAEDAKSFIEQSKQFINKQAQQDLLAAWRDLLFNVNNPANGEVERMVNGRIAIFGADKKFIRWKDDK